MPKNKSVEKIDVEWPDYVKERIEQAKTQFEAFKTNFGCQNTDLVVYGTVVSSREFVEHEKGPLWWLTDVVSPCDGRLIDLPGAALYIGRMDLGDYDGKRIKAIVELASEFEISKRGFALRARPLIVDVSEPEWEAIQSTVDKLTSVKELLAQERQTKQNVSRQVTRAKESLRETELKIQEATTNYESLKNDIHNILQQLDVLKTKRSILGFEDAFDTRYKESTTTVHSLKEIAEKAHAALLTSGGIYTIDFIRDFTVLLATGDLIVLAGSSGSGKTSLCREYARVTGNVCHVIPVKPNWTSADDLLGFYSPIEKRFLPTPFLNALVEAEQDPDRLHIICLDEMNLARPEYYFADFLSVLESRAKTSYIELNVPHRQPMNKELLHTILEIIPDNINLNTSIDNLLSLKDVKVKLLNAFKVNNEDELRNAWAKLHQMMEKSFEETGELAIPGNVRFVGTMNVDETTNFFALKILDRAHILHLSNPIFDNVPSELLPEPTVPFQVCASSFGRIEPYPKYSEESLVVKSLKTIGEKFFLPLRVDISLRVMRQAQHYEALALSAGMDNQTILANVIKHKLFPKCIFELEINNSNALQKLEQFGLEYQDLLPQNCTAELAKLVNMGKKTRSINWWLL